MNNLKPGDYRYRRKRNIELDGWMKSVQEKREESVLGIDWDKEQNLEQGQGEETLMFANNEIKVTEKTPLDDITVGEKKLNLNKFSIGGKSVETEKITIYLSKDLITTIKLLKKNKVISSYSKLISQALEQYLT